MTYIKTIAEIQASGPLKKIYEASSDRSGSVANIVKVMSLDPGSCQGSMGFYIALMKRPNALSAARREMLAAVVSNINACYYWTLSHARDFGRESGNQKAAQALIYDYRHADMSQADLALCDYAVRLTLDPGRVNGADLDRLREHGFEDDAITIAVQVIGYFNYINRVADGLGVNPEQWMSPSLEEWERRRARDWEVKSG